MSETPDAAAENIKHIRERVVQLLGQIADGVKAFLDETKEDNSHLRDNLANLHISHSDVNLAAGYLDKLGLIPDARRLKEAFFDLLKRKIDIELCDAARGETPAEIVAWTERFGTFPLPSDNVDEHNKVQEDRFLILTGLVLDFENWVRQLQTFILNSEKRVAARRSRKPRSPNAKNRRLTEIQRHTVEVVARHQGNINKAAKELGKDRKTVKQCHVAAMKKLGKDTIKYGKPGKKRTFLRDARGNEDISDIDDQRRDSDEDQARRYRRTE